MSRWAFEYPNGSTPRGVLRQWRLTFAGAPAPIVVDAPLQLVLVAPTTVEIFILDQANPNGGTGLRIDPPIVSAIVEVVAIVGPLPGDPAYAFQEFYLTPVP